MTNLYLLAEHIVKITQEPGRHILDVSKLVEPDRWEEFCHIIVKEVESVPDTSWRTVIISSKPEEFYIITRSAA